MVNRCTVQFSVFESGYLLYLKVAGLDRNFWIVVSGLQLLDRDFRIVFCGSRFPDRSFWITISGLQFLDRDCRIVVSGLRFPNLTFWLAISESQFLDRSFWIAISES